MFNLFTSCLSFFLCGSAIATTAWVQAFDQHSERYFVLAGPESPTDDQRIRIFVGTKESLAEQEFRVLGTNPNDVSFGIGQDALAVTFNGDNNTLEVLLGDMDTLDGNKSLSISAEQLDRVVSLGVKYDSQLNAIDTKLVIACELLLDSSHR